MPGDDNLVVLFGRLISKFVCIFETDPVSSPSFQIMSFDVSVSQNEQVRLTNYF
jgi:hypothetical protein